MEQQLPELERQLDATMHHAEEPHSDPAAGLFSEDHNFQENLLKESDKMIQFVTLSIKRASLGVV